MSNELLIAIIGLVAALLPLLGEVIKRLPSPQARGKEAPAPVPTAPVGRSPAASAEPARPVELLPQKASIPGTPDAVATPPPAPVALPVKVKEVSGEQRDLLPSSLALATEYHIVSHSILFYWWPVWMLGFLLAFLTYWENGRLGVLPAETRVESAGAEGKYLVTLAPGHAPTDSLKEAAERSGAGQPAFPVRVADSNRPFGLLFLGVLFLVIFVTTVSLRGAWSLVVLVGYLVLAFVLWVTGNWSVVEHLSIQINLAGYLFLSTALFTVWLIVFRFFDQQRYVIITPYSIRLCEEMGGGEVAYDVTGLTLSGQRNDLFRHWILGFGSGDLTVRTRDGREFRFPNVLFLRTKLQMIEDALRVARVERPN